MKFDELCERARELASKGADWNRVLFDDAVNNAYSLLSRSGELDKDKLESAFVEGRREFRVSKNWVVVWTSATDEYDQFDTEELECCVWHNQPLRKVLVHPEHVVYHRSRYMSGASIWEEDPREIERKIHEKLALSRAEDEAKKQVREAGLSWIASVDLNYSDEDAFDVVLRSHGLVWTDVRAEKKRRQDVQEAADRLVEWERCRATFANGCTIVDPGKDAQRGTYGPIPGRDCAIYRNVRVVPHWKDNADEARVETDTGEFVGLLRRVADRLASGEYRVAAEGEQLLPAAVMKRLRRPRLDQIVRVEVEGRVVWVGRESYLEIVVLDERGRVVRKNSIVQAAMIAYHASNNY